MSGDESVISAFKNPPVEEFVLGLQFPPIPEFSDAYAGLYWQRVREEYPKLSSVPRIEGPIESLAPPQALRVEIPFGMSGQPQNRTWLVSKSDEYVIQIQNTRFIFNWRRRQSPYPRFDRLRELFFKHYADFCTLLEDEGLQRPNAQQIELSYINWITDLPVEDFFAPARSTSIAIDGGGIKPEDQSWSARYLLGNDPSLVKRLYVQCQSAFRVADPTSPVSQQDPPPQGVGQQGYQFGFTFKAARTSGLDKAEIASLLDEARVTVVPAFTGLTTAHAHEVWGRYK